MRPIELTLDGFRSYHGPAIFRWEDRHLVGVVGPIGSGKTTILDGISFALYARTPRGGVNVSDLVGQRRQEGKVALVFEVDGSRWKVVRSLRTSGQSAHALYEVIDGQDVTVADRAREVTARVEQLLGLDFAAFQRSVMLAQGEFDAFLSGTTGDRDAVLKGVFDLGRLAEMRTAAQMAVATASADLDALDQLRSGMAAKQAALATTCEEAGPARIRADLLAALLEPLTEAGVEETGHLAAEAAAREELTRLDPLSDALPDPRSLAALVKQANEAGAGVVAAAEALASAGAAIGAAVDTHAEVVAAAGGEQGLRDAGGLLARLEAEEAQAVSVATTAAAAEDAAVAAGQRITDAQLVVADNQRAADLASAAAVEAAAMVDEATRALHEARHADMALTLRSELTSGGACPVCEQTVSEVPAQGATPHLTEASVLLEGAEANKRAADEAVLRTGGDVAASRAGLEAATVANQGALEAAASLVQRRVDVEAVTAATRDALAGILGDGDPAATLAAHRAAVEAAAAALNSARAAEQEARAGHDRAVAVGSESSAGITALVPGLTRVAVSLGSDIEVTGDPKALEDVVRSLRRAWIDANEAAGSRAATAAAGAAAARLRQADLIEGSGLSPEDDPRVAATDAAVTAATLEDRIRGLEADLQQLTDLEGRQADLVTERDRYQRLVDDLAPSRFPRHVLDERRRALSELGGDLFEQLSGGRYRFTDDGEFGVVDLGAAERVRPADTLSGGETFLGSLALALALAETVAREGGRLDAFFLDEGFGSLDFEHLDLAMEGVERLSEMGDRLVVVVSHVAALTERIEDLVVLDKDAITGDTRVVSGSG